MSESPFFQFYPSDWLAGTRGLTAAETGVYITLVAMMYEAEGPIPNDPKRLARLCGSTPATLAKIVSGLVDSGKLTEDERGFFNRRVEIEIKKRAEKRSAASASANARWKKTVENQQPENANASDTQCERNANQKPDTRDKKEDTPLPPKGGDEADFLMFWESYPHRAGAKKNRKGALAKWRAAIKRGVTAEDMMAGVERMKADPTVARGYARDAVTWLNQEGWTDEIAAQPSNVIPMPGRTVLPNGDVDCGYGWVWTPGDPYEYNLKTGDVRDAKHIRDRRNAEAEIAMRGCL